MMIANCSFEKLNLLSFICIIKYCPNTFKFVQFHIYSILLQTNSHLHFECPIYHHRLDQILQFLGLEHEHYPHVHSILPQVGLKNYIDLFDKRLFVKEVNIYPDF